MNGPRWRRRIGMARNCGGRLPGADRAGGTSTAKARAGRGVYIKPMGREETFEDVSWRGRIAGAGDSSRR